MPTNIDSPLARRIAAFAFLVFIFGSTFWVLSPFFASLAWAGILAYVTWPLHLRINRRLPGHENAVALLMTLGVAATLLLPLVWVMFTVVGDVATASVALKRLAAEGLPPLPDGVRGWPAADWLIAQYGRVQGDAKWVREQMATLGQEMQMAGGPPTPVQVSRMRMLQDKLHQGGLWGAILLVVAVAAMSVARYL